MFDIKPVNNSGNVDVSKIYNIQSILNLDGDIVMKVSDEGAMQITIDSGLALYNYILPAQAK